MKRGKKIKLSPFNKIGDYMTFYESDQFLSEFMDYVGFYGKRDHSRILTLLRSDNGGCLYLSRRLVLTNINKTAHFTAFVSVSLYGSPVNVCQLREITIEGKVVLDVDLYGKGLKLIREEGLREELYLLFTYYLGMSDIIITRADYTVDCMKRNFDKENSLSTRSGAEFFKFEDGKKMLKSRYFGRGRHDSARFLRYYDKKEEIKTRETSHLYPEYSLIPFVMRYELQVNSKGFKKYERTISIDQLYHFVTLGLDIRSSEGKHLVKYKDNSLEQLVIEGIKKLQSKDQKDSLEKVKLLLLGEKYLDYENYICEN